MNLFFPTQNQENNLFLLRFSKSRGTRLSPLPTHGPYNIPTSPARRRPCLDAKRNCVLYLEHGRMK